MTLIDGVASLFWNRQEKRLRAGWRMALFTILVQIMTSLFLVGPSLLVSAIGLITGTGSVGSAIIGGQNLLLRNPAIATLMTTGAILAGILLATWFMGRWIDRRKVSDFGFTFSRDWWRNFAFGLGLGALLMSLIFLVGWTTGNFRVTGFFVSFPDGFFLPGLLIALLMFICGGIYEEVLFRGYYLVNLAEGLHNRRVSARWAIMVAFLITSSIFGVSHLSNPNANWTSTLNVTLAGIFLGLGMVLTGSLAIPIGLHIAWNFFQGNIFGFPVSGIDMFSTVIATEFVGPDWITGGNFGPEAGILGFGAMILGSVLTVLWIKRRTPITIRKTLAEYAPAQVTSADPNKKEKDLVY